MVGKVYLCCCDLIEALISQQHLTKCLVSVGLSPRFLHHLNMFRFSDQRTKSIWGTEFLNEKHVVSERVLLWKREAIWMDSTLLEDGAVVVESRKCILKLHESFRVNNIVT